MRHARTLLGILVSALFLWLLLARVDRAELLDAFRAVQVGWLAPALLLLAASVWVRAERWRSVIGRTVSMTSWQATSLVTIGLAANNVFPARAGELARALLVRQRHGGSSATALGTIVVERILDGLVLALFLAGTVALAGSTPLLRGFAALCALGFGAGTLATVALGLWPARGRALLTWLLHFAPRAIRTRVQGLLGRFLEGLMLLRGPGAWAQVLALTLATWLLEAGAYVFVGRAFGLDLHPLLYLGVCGAANLAIAAPSTSGGIGPYEFFAREVVVRFGATAAAGTAFALVLHAFVLVPIAVAGFAIAWAQNVRVGSLRRQAPLEVAAEASGVTDAPDMSGRRT
ncbi:MAG: lysylphosphatidylglycerol synthase transmembrane domain-containing protein [Chloroflexi bacterium]|nr:lysylphosphatidylglycerol synthase transmembrane domain-containing protein [Chloroflexota bacterium]MDA1239942.1 lysylphosphatidylglycerol synthase transmembrane domain-containing protein [Chloroflexota bacterium]MQC25646.1 UPF0104 family protein [Chloroflexota bacterium]MQC48080.1 UPF0104 family protein [Chloroflexota bacterium]